MNRHRFIQKRMAFETFGRHWFLEYTTTYINVLTNHLMTIFSTIIFFALNYSIEGNRL